MRLRDKYLKIVEWSEEDQCYIGTCPGFMLGGIHGDNEIRREIIRVKLMMAHHPGSTASSRSQLAKLYLKAGVG